MATFKFQTQHTKLKITLHIHKHLTRVTALGCLLAAFSFSLVISCSKEKKKTTNNAPEELKEELVREDEETDTKTAFPTLDILPEGSILRRVRLPRYDKDFNPLSLLSADKLTVLDRYQIEAESVSIEMYNQDGSVQARTKMRHAVYNQKDSTLVAKEAIYIKGESFKASGTGMILDWKTGRGFLLGPATTLFQIKESQPKSPTKPTKQK